MPRRKVAQFVPQDFTKEAVLKKTYGIVITSEQLEVEVKRTNATNRGPEILAEFRAASTVTLVASPGRWLTRSWWSVCCAHASTPMTSSNGAQRQEAEGARS